MPTWSRFKNRLIAKIITRYPALSRRLVDAYAPWESEDVPWTPVTKPLAESRLALVTTAGVHQKNQPPFDMNHPHGDASVRFIDGRLPLSALMITHDYYDHSDAEKDMNIVFPLDRLREFQEDGVIRELAPTHYGFMGHIDGPLIAELISRSAPRVVSRMQEEQVDVVLLTPG